MLRREILAVYCETHMKYTQYVRAKCSFFNIKRGGAKSTAWTSKG
jgi:hypothetical protein